MFVSSHEMKKIALSDPLSFFEFIKEKQLTEMFNSELGHG